ncbi:Fc.00g016320.m01.CDS01 [Cosmosporella sp. VM-42]
MSKRIAKAPLGARAAGVSKVYKLVRSVRDTTARIFEAPRRLGAVSSSSFRMTAKFLTSLQYYNITATGLSSLTSITTASRNYLHGSVSTPEGPPTVIVTSPTGLVNSVDMMPLWRRMQRTEASMRLQMKWRRTRGLSPLKPVDAAAERRNKRKMSRAARKHRAWLQAAPNSGWKSAWESSPGTNRQWNLRQ